MCLFTTNPFLFRLPDLFRLKQDPTAEMLKLKGLDDEPQEKVRKTKKKRGKRRK